LLIPPWCGVKPEKKSRGVFQLLKPGNKLDRTIYWGGKTCSVKKRASELDTGVETSRKKKKQTKGVSGLLTKNALLS